LGSKSESGFAALPFVQGQGQGEIINSRIRNFCLSVQTTNAFSNEKTMPDGAAHIQYGPHDWWVPAIGGDADNKGAQKSLNAIILIDICAWRAP
jgi:hypothetical protein